MVCVMVLRLILMTKMFRIKVKLKKKYFARNLQGERLFLCLNFENFENSSENLYFKFNTINNFRQKMRKNEHKSSNFIIFQSFLMYCKGLFHIICSF